MPRFRVCCVRCTAVLSHWLLRSFRKSVRVPRVTVSRGTPRFAFTSFPASASFRQRPPPARRSGCVPPSRSSPAGTRPCSSRRGAVPAPRRPAPSWHRASPSAPSGRPRGRTPWWCRCPRSWCRIPERCRSTGRGVSLRCRSGGGIRWWCRRQFRPRRRKRCLSRSRSRRSPWRRTPPRTTTTTGTWPSIATGSGPASCPPRRDPGWPRRRPPSAGRSPAVPPPRGGRGSGPGAAGQSETVCTATAAPG
mmetsp:Transcript_27368/g.58543  ORF Transcript_27368/g.58543 Transcript_27368/m.58543 type:complete len:249 (-) Transcript_27368:608-1354(-)